VANEPIIVVIVHVGDDLVIVGQRPEHRTFGRRAAISHPQDLRHQPITIMLDRPAQRL
jgi:hypothetical protein